MGKKRRIAIMTSGGDCPGINAVIRAITKKAITEYGMEVIGIEDGGDGLVHNRHRKLHFDDVSGILTVGGTILGTSKSANPFKYPVKENNGVVLKDYSKRAIRNLKKLNIECLISIGGDGTMRLSDALYRRGVPVIGVPKTIDNDIKGTEITFGFFTAVEIATEGIDRIHSTAQSHHRIMIVEVMGHHAGWIALHSGIAGGGDIILIPEMPYDVNAIVAKVKERNRKGKRFSIIVVAEGAKPKGGDIVIQRMVKESADPVRLGGVGFVLGEQIEKLTGLETRTVVMGHLLRGGEPCAFDRVLSTRFGTKAVEMVNKKQFGCMVAARKETITHVLISKIAKGPRTIPRGHPLIKSAMSVGTSFGV